MNRTRAFALAALAFLALPWAAARADFYVGFGRPYRYRYYRLSYPVRVYVAPAPVYVAPRMVYVTPAPAAVVVQPAPTYLQTPPPGAVPPVPVPPPGS
jgi:hypothetical protein